MNDKLISKIQKLLRLAESPNQHEAELALSRAKQIATENDIDLASVNSAEETKYTKDELQFGGRFPVTARYAVTILLEHFNVKIVYAGGRQSGRKMYFIGKTQDVEIGVYIFKYLTDLFVRLWHQYQEITRLSCSSKESYLVGLQIGLSRKLKEAKEQAKINKFNSLNQERGVDATKLIQNNYSLMIIKNNEALVRAEKEFFPDLKKGAKWKYNIKNKN